MYEPASGGTLGRVPSEIEHGTDFIVVEPYRSVYGTMTEAGALWYCDLSFEFGWNCGDLHLPDGVDRYPTGLAFGPDGALYVATQAGEILRYRIGPLYFPQFDRVFASSGESGLRNPRGITFGPDGDLYVSNGDNTHEILRFRGADGSFWGVFVGKGSGGLRNPQGLTFGPDDQLYVVSQNQVLQFNGMTGAFLGVYVTERSGGLWGPRDAKFGGDGDLYVSSGVTDEVLKYWGPFNATPREEEGDPLTESLVLHGNFPNPVTGATLISYSLPVPAEVTLTVIDVLGRRVDAREEGLVLPGVHEFSVDASVLPPGVYFYTLTAGPQSETRSLVVVR
jgi:hypothetical protein